MKKLIACLCALVFTIMSPAIPAGAQSDIVAINPGNGKVSFSLTGADEVLDIRMFEGNYEYRYSDGESVETGSFPLTGDLRINAKAGDDIIRVIDVYSHGSIEILAGRGNDIVNVIRPDLAGDLRILAQAGEDLVRVVAPEPVLPIDSMDPMDSLDGEPLDIVVPVEPVYGYVGGDLSILAANDADWVVINNVVVGEDLLIRAGDDNADDTVVIAATDTYGTARVYSGAGDDTVVWRNGFHDGDASVTTATGDDSVLIVDSVFQGRLNVNAGARDDRVRVRRSVFGGNASFDGGSNIDFESIDHMSNFFLADLNIVAFEGPIPPAPAPEE